MAVVPPTTGIMDQEQGGSTDSRRSCRDRDCDRNNNQPKFKGWIAGLEQSVFNVQHKNSDAFNTSMKKLAEHIARTITNGGDFIRDLDPENLGFKSLNEPPDPGAIATLVDIEKWKTRHKNWNTKSLG